MLDVGVFVVVVVCLVVIDVVCLVVVVMCGVQLSLWLLFV